MQGVSNIVVLYFYISSTIYLKLLFEITWLPLPLLPLKLKKMAKPEYG
jgi:hypothetical protein